MEKSYAPWQRVQSSKRMIFSITYEFLENTVGCFRISFSIVLYRASNSRIMVVPPNSTIYILYGSQTGNAEAISREVTGVIREAIHTNIGSSQCVDNKIDIVCSSLQDAIVRLDTLKEAALVCIVCSTTGNGDPPDNASKFWRIIKKRTAAKDMFQDMPVALLGLGDSNYDQFCYIGKSMHKRLLELGARPIIDLTCIDEVDGLEEPVEEWMDRIESHVLKNMCK